MTNFCQACGTVAFNPKCRRCHTTRRRSGELQVTVEYSRGERALLVELRGPGLLLVIHEATIAAASRAHVGRGPVLLHV